MTLADILYGADQQNGAGLKANISILKASDYQGHTITDNEITAYTGSPTFNTYQAARKSVKFAVTTGGDNDARHFTTEGEFFIPKIDKTKSLQLGQLVNHPCILVLRDRNGQLRQVGDEWDGTEIMVDEQTEGQNGYLVKFTVVEDSHPPYFVQSESVVTGV